MKLSIGELRELLNEAGEPTKIGASPTYMKKEHVREVLQDVVVAGVKTGDIVDEDSLRQRFSDVKLALTALESIPFEVWKKLARQ